MLPKAKSGTTFVIETHIPQWEDLMKKFSRKHMEKCKAAPLEVSRSFQATKKFPTGSVYAGDWDLFGINGYGEYTFPNGVQYRGTFEDGLFHGKGELVYPHDDDISLIRGKFDKGVMTERTLVFNDILEYRENGWKYCTMPDRRFAIEYDSELKPAGESYLTAEQPTKEIPEGLYDTGDGLFDPINKVIYKYHDNTSIKRAPSVREQEWIIANCRRGTIEPLGPRPDLYERWTPPTLFSAANPAPAAGAKPSCLFKFRKSSIYDYEYADGSSGPAFYDFAKFAAQLADTDSDRPNRKFYRVDGF